MLAKFQVIFLESKSDISQIQLYCLLMTGRNELKRSWDHRESKRFNKSNLPRRGKFYYRIIFQYFPKVVTL